MHWYLNGSFLIFLVSPNHFLHKVMSFQRLGDFPRYGRHQAFDYPVHDEDCVLENKDESKTTGPFSYVRFKVRQVLSLKVW